MIDTTHSLMIDTTHSRTLHCAREGCHRAGSVALCHVVGGAASAESGGPGVTWTVLGAVHRWRGTESNNFFLYADHKGLGMGGGGEGYAFWIDSSFKFGSSHKSDTFGNFVLNDDTEFICVKMEVWGFELPVRRRIVYA